MANPGYKPDPDAPVPVNLMAEPEYQPTLREFLSLGVGKAHRQVNYSHYEHRNFRRSNLGTTGKVK
jgi:hypothetical protein